MATGLNVRTRAITRDKLTAALKNHELVKAFENLTQDVSQTLPDAISMAASFGAALSADISEDGGAFADAGDLVLPLSADALYLVEGVFTFRSNAAIPSVQLGFALPDGATISGRYGHCSDTAALTGSAGAPGATAATGPLALIEGRWFISTGSAIGSAQLRFRTHLPTRPVTLIGGRCILLATRIS